MGAIDLRHVTKRYADGTVAVDAVDLTVEDGELMVLVGPSGCGKSTLLRMIAGLEDVSDGEIVVGGETVNDRAPKDRNIAMVFQNYALYPHMTVRENMAFPLKLAKLPADEIRAKVDEAARILDLEEHLERKPANLSGGQRQRVAMGRAIVRRPEAFLLDEPLSNLDAQLRVQMRTEVARLQHRLGTTTVYVTHDQTEAMTLGDRVAVLRKGVLQQVAPPQELYEHPANLFVAGFIGSPGMNFVPAVVEDGRLRLPMFSCALPERWAERLAGSEVERMVAGLRPEHFEDAALVPDADKGHGAAFTAAVDVVESLGSDLFAHFDVEEGAGVHADARELAALSEELSTGPTSRLDLSEVVARLNPASRVRRNTDAELWFDLRQLHLFDAETGENLALRGGIDLREQASAPPVSSRF